jgi:hypothetical protein
MKNKKYKVFIGKRPLGRPVHRWDDIRAYFRERVWTGFICLRIKASGGPL